MILNDVNSGQVSIAYSIDVKSYNGIFIKFKLVDGATKFTLTLNSNGSYPYKLIESNDSGWQSLMISFDELNGYNGENFSYIIIKPEAGKTIYIDKVSLVSLE